jgi:hypothetical protein
MRLLIGIVTLTALAVTTAIPAASASMQRDWRLTDVVRPCGRAPSGLLSVSAVSPADAWALGSVVATHCAGFLEHWNGRSWRPTRIPAELSTDLDAPPVAASSASDVWVFPIPNPLGTDYAMRWNGRRWRSSDFPRPMVVASAEVFGGSNVWAFGDTVRDGIVGDVPYAARYNGKRWRLARMPGAPVSVGATSATDMWAVGPANRTAAKPVRQQTLIGMHWNGRSWASFVLPAIQWPKGATQASGHLVAVSPTEFWWQYTSATDGGDPDGAGLLRCSARVCQQIALPPNAIGVLDMAQDGRGGVVISALDENRATYNSWQEWYDYSAGRWSGQGQLSPRGYNSTYSGLAWIPGTDSVWSVGEADSNSGRARVLSEGVIVRFG